MIHLCSCGFELAPEDGVEPVGAVSHGLCAPCLFHMSGRRSPAWYLLWIGDYKVELLIQPGRDSPHVSYDSPRRWDPPRPIRVIGQRVYMDGVELDPAEFKDLCAEARERANLPGGRPSARPAFPRQLRLRLNGLLRTAMERTDYAE
jgi:hypothetical protein